MRVASSVLCAARDGDMSLVCIPQFAHKGNVASVARLNARCQLSYGKRRGEHEGDAAVFPVGRQPAQRQTEIRGSPRGTLTSDPKRTLEIYLNERERERERCRERERVRGRPCRKKLEGN